MPYSLVFDDCGIYYDPHRPSKIEHILNEMGRHPEHYRRAVERAQGLIQTVVRHGITKYNVGSINVTLPDVPRDRRVLLVTGQVDGDASVRRGGGDIQSNAALLTTVRKTIPTRTSCIWSTRMWQAATVRARLLRNCFEL